MTPGVRAVVFDRFDPFKLGADLLAIWDAERADLMTLGGGNEVSSWRDIKNGYDMTSTSTLRPIWSATSFNGFPGLTFDGINDFLTMASQPFPAGASPCEMHAVVQQDALPADTSVRIAFSYGGGVDTTFERTIRRAVATGVNRGAAQSGTGVASVARNGTLVDLSTRHLVVNRVTATAVNLVVDGVADGSAAIVSVTPTVRTRIGTSSVDSPAFFWSGKIAVVAVTNPLDAGRAAALQAYLMSRRRI